MIHIVNLYILPKPMKSVLLSAGDLCDDDIDGDSVTNANDNCPYVSNSGQIDVNGNIFISLFLPINLNLTCT